jgi:hypothetical protein
MPRYRNDRVTPQAIWRFTQIFDSFRGGPWVKYASNPVLEKGAGGAWDSLGIRDPRLLVDLNGYLVTEGGKIIMYYSGYKTAAPHYERAIGRAISADGLAWTKYGSNPVLEKGAAGQWDDFGVQYPTLIKLGSSSYYMAYSGVNSDWSEWGIGIATSSDGLTWGKYVSNPVLTADDFTLGGNEILSFPSVIKDGSKIYMLLGGTYDTNYYEIFGAESDDGYVWTALNGGDPVIDLSSTRYHYSTIDNVEGPMLYKIGESEYAALYHWNHNIVQGRHYIGLATSSDMVNWTKYFENPILVPGDTGEWDCYRVEVAFIPKEDMGTETLRMWYCGAPTLDGEDESAIGYATSDQRTY